MSSFNALLIESGVDPIDVHLVRHQQSSPSGRTPYVLWHNNRNEFDIYQCLQLREVFRRNWIASFVVLGNSTLFVGLYKNVSRARTQSITQCPITKKSFPAGSMWNYALELDLRLSDLSGRLVIDWGVGFRSWVQRAVKQPKTILEIKSKPSEIDFPGYANFHIRMEELAAPDPSWIEKLSVHGVYLLTFVDGQQYIGSATGAGGLWQRWQDYLRDGHGGNVALRGRNAREAMVSILETSRLSDTRDDIINLEFLWKRKLGSRVEQLVESNEQQELSGTLQRSAAV